MSKFEIEDPELRRRLHAQNEKHDLTEAHNYARARLMYNYIVQKYSNQSALSPQQQTMCNCFGWFFGVVADDFAPQQKAFLEELVVNITPVMEDSDISAADKTRIIYACGNVYEMSRILIEIANALFRMENSSTNTQNES